MRRKTRAAGSVPLIIVAGLLAAGCGGSAASGGGGTDAAAGPAAGSSNGGSSGSGGPAGGSPAAGAASCSHGLTPAVTGVVDVFCSGTAKFHVRVGSVSKDIVGGDCHSVPGDNVWTASAGVITQYGVYKGPAVDSVAVNNTSSGGGTIQLTLNGKTYLVDGGTFDLSDGAKAAHLRGKATSESDGPGALVTVDITC
ncbi:MAG TPA: hypothetical protein VH637_06840 [Streptosporangiaceae bacterium]